MIITINNANLEELLKDREEAIVETDEPETIKDESKVVKES